jgi:hypothetical protein
MIMQLKIYNAATSTTATKWNERKTVHRLVLVGSLAGLLVGCATTDEGGMGNQSQSAVSSGDSQGSFSSAPVPASPTGPNGSISPGNPFGFDTGTGLTRAQ